MKGGNRSPWKEKERFPRILVWGALASKIQPALKSIGKIPLFVRQLEWEIHREDFIASAGDICKSSRSTCHRKRARPNGNVVDAVNGNDLDLALSGKE